MRRNQIAKLSQNSELGCGWFGLSFFHLCRVTKLKSHANHFFLCFNRNSYGMAVKRSPCCEATPEVRFQRDIWTSPPRATRSPSSAVEDVFQRLQLSDRS